MWVIVSLWNLFDVIIISALFVLEFQRLIGGFSRSWQSKANERERKQRKKNFV